MSEKKYKNSGDIMDNKNRLTVLQGIRALAFLGIFSEHAGITHLGSWGVSCFLILSGFLMYYNYGDNVEETQYYFWDNVRLAIKKVLKIYPLHCLTLLVAIPIYFNMARFDNVRHIVIWIFKLISNIVLLQSWVPKSEFYWSFNAVSWYLSLQLAMYFAFPYIRKRINRNTNNKRIGLSAFLIVIVQIVISSLLISQSARISQIPLTISDDLTFYLTYICPLYRLGDFYLGCIVGYFFVHKRKLCFNNAIVYSLLEIAIVLFLFLLQIIYNKQIGIIGNDAFRNDLLYTFQVVFLIYIMALRKGVVSKYILSSTILVELGNISGYCFLFHQLVIVVMRRIYGTNMSNLSIAIISIMLTVGLAYIWKYGMTKWQEWYGCKREKF